IIPTFNRCALLPRALDSVLSQSRRVGEIVVVDDGSTDDTRLMLEQRYAGRVRYIRQDNAGVSAARNRGMTVASGRYLALLDSDDQWLPDKNARQVEWMEANPGFGMVLCDVFRVDPDYLPIDVLHRRKVISEDGWVLRHVLQDPAFAPSSALFKKDVFDAIGGFDESLRTAEDLDFLLRTARHWQVGVVEEPLVKAMHGHDGLSSEACTYDDYLQVIDRALDLARGQVEDADLRRARGANYARIAKGMFLSRRWQRGAQLTAEAVRLAPDQAARMDALKLLPFAARRALRGLFG
ncbi:MAG: glycosyltransferase, partial [Lysobacteraceae bacterium]